MSPALSLPRPRPRRRRRSPAAPEAVAVSVPRRAAPAVAVAGLILFVLFVLLAGLVLGVAALRPGPLGGPGPRAGDPGEGTVIRVVDGDTVVVDIGGAEESVRLIGIDTPETVAPNRPVECFGAEASRRLGELLPVGTEVRLERDVEPRDRYDRLLAYVFRSDDGLFLNHVQVSEGFAEAREYPPNTARRTELDGAERAARAAGAGLWAACGGADTPAGGVPAGVGPGGPSG